MMKIKTTIILLTLLLSVSLVAQDTYVRSAVIPVPAIEAGGFGNVVAGVDFDGDGNLEIYAVNNNWNDGPEEVIPRIYKYEFNGTTWDSVWSTVLDIPMQNTWPTLNKADLDQDGKMEIVWGVPNNFGGGSTPSRFVIYETPGDGSDNMGVSDGADGWLPNARWDFDLPADTEMRGVSAIVGDYDGDGVTEVAFADRRGEFSLAIFSVSDVPDAADGSETWTQEFNGNTPQTGKFVRNGVIDGPDGGFGNMVSGMDYDADGYMDMYAVNNNWNDGADGELIPTLYKYEYVADAWVLQWSAAIAGMDYQNTWPILVAGDWDGDGKGEVIWCPVNNFGAGNEDPDRIVVYETPGDGSDIMGIDNGDGTASPNAGWNMNVPASTSMRPFRGQLTDIDGDGALEFLFAERHNYFVWGVVGVDNIPDAGDGSETWTMEAAGANLPSSNNLNLTFEDDSDIANWGNHDEATVYTTVAHNATAGVDGSGALELGDAGYAFLSKRAVVATPGAAFSVSVDIKTEGWAVPETYMLYLVVEGFADLDTVQINSDTAFATFTLSGTATGTDGYIKIAGGNTAGQNYVWVDNLVFTNNSGAPDAGNDYRDLAVIDQTMYLFGSDGDVRTITNDGTAYTVSDRHQAYPGWSWLSANTVDVDKDGTEEIVTGDYLSGGTSSVWVLTPDADSLVGTAIADFSANSANRITSVRAGHVDADTLVDFVVGFRGTDEVFLVSYQGGDITSSASYVVTKLDSGVLGAPGTGQVDMMTLEDINGDGTDEVFYAGVPRGVSSNASPITIGSVGDWTIGSSLYDIVQVDSTTLVGVNLDGDIFPISYNGMSWDIGHAQVGLNSENGDFLSSTSYDVDGDGTNEIFYGEYWGTGQVYMLKQMNGAYHSYNIADLSLLGAARLTGGAAGDIDGDGNVDLVFGTRESTPSNSVYRVKYTGGDVTDMASWSAEVIDSDILGAGGQIDQVILANMDADADLEVVYTGIPRGGGLLPIVVLDVQKIVSESISDVRVDANGDYVPDRLGEIVTVKAVITSPTINSLFSLSITVQDVTGGINVYSSEDSIFTTVGDLVLITGEISQYNGLTQLTVSDRNDIIRLGTGTLPTPVVLTIAEWMADPEKYESVLIKINALADTGEGDAWPDSNSNANINMWDGFMDFTMRVDKDLDLDGQPEPVYPVNVTGVTGQYSTATPPNTGYQLFPRYYTDIEQDVAAPPSPYFFFTDETKALDGSNLDVNDADADYPFVWHPAVDLNGEDLIYQIYVWNADDDSKIIEALSDNNGIDTLITPSGQDLIDMIMASSSDSTLTVGMTMRTVSSNAAEGIIPSVDTIYVTLVDHVTDVNDRSIIPKDFFVDQNYPNPFNPTTTIQFGLPSEAKVNLVIYDILGRVVTRLIDNRNMAAGVHQHHFDASHLASGTYIYRLQAGQKVEVKKMLLLK